MKHAEFSREVSFGHVEGTAQEDGRDHGFRA